jgi:hypothetical protein
LRFTVHRLGRRRPAQDAFALPAARTERALPDNAMAGKALPDNALGDNGLPVFRRLLGEHQMDTGVRGDDRDSYREWITAVRAPVGHGMPATGAQGGEES